MTAFQQLVLWTKLWQFAWQKHVSVMPVISAKLTLLVSHLYQRCLLWKPWRTDPLQPSSPVETARNTYKIIHLLKGRTIRKVFLAGGGGGNSRKEESKGKIPMLQQKNILDKQWAKINSAPLHHFSDGPSLRKIFQKRCHSTEAQYESCSTWTECESYMYYWSYFVTHHRWYLWYVLFRFLSPLKKKKRKVNRKETNTWTNAGANTRFPSLERVGDHDNFRYKFLFGCWIQLLVILPTNKWTKDDQMKQTNNGNKK